MAKALRVAVVDASPCIGLAQIGQLRLLPTLFARVLVAQSVVNELLAGNRDDHAWEIVRHQNVEVHVGRVRIGMAPTALSEADLDTIGLARSMAGVDVVVLDDHAARKFAKAQGLTVIGTVGIIALATTRGLLQEARPWFAELADSGFHVSEDLLNRQLAALGEPPL